jgi:hypothetical protein
MVLKMVLAFQKKFAIFQPSSSKQSSLKFNRQTDTAQNGLNSQAFTSNGLQ